MSLFCNGTVADLGVCIQDNTIDECPYLGDGTCVTPLPASKLDLDVLIKDASPEVLDDWCAWRLCLSGRPGYVPTTCELVEHVAVPQVAVCVEDLQTVFASCEVKLADVEACVLQLHDNDACHRISTFGACAKTGEWLPCHLLWPPECQAVRECLEEAWDIAIGSK